MAVVSQGVAHVVQAAGVVAFAVQSCIGIRYVRVVAAALVLEVGAVAVILTAVFAHEALVTGPRLDEGPVHAEVLA